MIIGQVSAFREAVISLKVVDPASRGREFDAVVDTGFNGFLTLPASSIRDLGLVWRGRGRAMLADGTDCLFDRYDATVFWDSRPRRIVVDEAESDPLVGMSLLDGHELTIQVTEGGRVTVAPLA